MNAYVSKEELALLPANRMSYPEHLSEALFARRTARPGLVTQIKRAVAAYFERQSVMAELSDLTDRELADIGLQRAEIGAVFDKSFDRRG